jgi:hypothetical protein
VRRSARTKIETEAEEVEHEHRRAIRLGEIHPLDPWPKPPAPEAPTLKEFTNRFLEYARLQVKESSFEFYTGAVSRLLRFPELASAQISKINPEIVARFAGSRKAAGVALARSMVICGLYVGFSGWHSNGRLFPDRRLCTLCQESEPEIESSHLKKNIDTWPVRVQTSVR